MDGGFRAGILTASNLSVSELQRVDVRLLVDVVEQ